MNRTPVHCRNGFEKFMILSEDEDLRTLNMVLVYEAVRKKRTGVKVYKVIPSGIDPRNHKKWKLFEKARKLCDEHGFPYEEFLSAQFIEMKSWSKCPIPMPNHLFSDGAIDRYHTFLARWNKSRQRLGLDEPMPKSGTSEYYDRLVSDYVQRQKKLGVMADMQEFITIMTATGSFPVWYGVRKVPDWKRRAKHLGFGI